MKVLSVVQLLRSHKYIFIFFCITFISASMESGYYFLLPYLSGRGISVGMLGGVVMGICYGVSFVARPFVPLLERRFTYDRILKLGYVCFFISALGIAAFTKTIESAVVWRGISGLGLSLVGISLTAYERHFIPESVRGQSIALITTAYSLPSLAVVPVMEFLVTQNLLSSYVYTFPVMLALGTIVIRKLPKMYDSFKASDVTSKPNTKMYLELISDVRIVIFIITAALFALTDAGQLVFVKLAEEKNVQASYFFSVSAGIALFFRIIFGRLIDILPRKICAAAAAGITSAMMITVTLVSSPAAFMVCGFIFGIGMGFGYPMLMCLILDLGGRKYTTRLAVVFGLVYSGSFFIAPVAVEFIDSIFDSAVLAYRGIYSIIFFAAAVLTLLSAKIYKKAGNLEMEWS